LTFFLFIVTRNLTQKMTPEKWGHSEPCGSETFITSLQRNLEEFGNMG
jgi:hypothetical protein